MNSNDVLQNHNKHCTYFYGTLQCTVTTHLNENFRNLFEVENTSVIRPLHPASQSRACLSFLRNNEEKKRSQLFICLNKNICSMHFLTEKICYNFKVKNIITIERERKLFSFERIGADGLSGFWWVILAWVFIRSNWSLCHYIEQVINCRFLCFRVGHFSASYFFRQLSKNILTLFCYQTLHIWYENKKNYLTFVS